MNPNEITRRERSFPVKFEIVENGGYRPSTVKVIYAGDDSAVAPPPATLPEIGPSEVSAEAQSERETNANATLTSAAAPSASSTEPPSSRAEDSAEPSHPAPRSSRSASVPPDFSRHARRCGVCSHPDCDLIEAEFVRWRSPDAIAREYQLADRAAIYRHAHATGLFASRKRELGRVLENILECVEYSGPESADVIIRAARVYSHLDHEGKWFEPPRTNFVFAGSIDGASMDSHRSRAFPVASSSPSLPVPAAGQAAAVSQPARRQSPVSGRSTSRVHARRQKSNRNSPANRK